MSATDVAIQSTETTDLVVLAVASQLTVQQIVESTDLLATGVSIVNVGMVNTATEIQQVVLAAPQGSSFYAVADGAIGGHRAVRPSVSGKVGYVDPSNPLHAGTAIGISAGAAADGDTLLVYRAGDVVEEPSWSWQTGRPVFIGASAVPSQAPPSTGFQEVIGVATSPTSLIINFKNAIILEG